MRGAETERAPFRHGIACVDRDVEQRRLELARVGEHLEARRRHLDVDPDALVERAAEQVGEREQHRSDVDGGRLQHLPARERKQLAGEVGAPTRGARSRLDEFACLLVGSERRQVAEHLQVALDDGEQVVEIVRDPAGELADALEPLRMAQRFLGLRALQAAGEQIGQRLEETHLVVAEEAACTRADDQDADGAAASRERHAERAPEARFEVAGRDAETRLERVVANDDRASLGQHEAERSVGPVGYQMADRLAAHRSCHARHAQLQRVRLQQVDHRDVDLERIGGDTRDPVEQHLGVARIDRKAADVREVFAVVGALQRLLHSWVRADVADRGDHERLPLLAQRTEGDLDHHLAAVLAPGDELGLLAHRTGLRLATEGAAVFGVARADGVGHQLVDSETDQLVDRVAEQGCRRRVRQHDRSAAVGDDQRVGIGGKQAAVDAARVAADKALIGRWRRCSHRLDLTAT